MQWLNYDTISQAFPPAREHDRVGTNLGVHPDWRIDGKGSLKIVGCPRAIGSIADFIPANRHVDHLQMDDVIFIQFGLTGAIEYHLANGQHYRQAGQRLSFFALARGASVERIIPGGQQIRYVGISLRVADLKSLGCEPEFLHEDLQALLEQGARHPLLVNFTLTPAQFSAADDLLSNRFTGRLREHYVNAKISELTCLAIDQLVQTGRGAAARSACDRANQALEIAIRIASTETGGFWSIAELARRVGLNRNKLVAGFKERLGVTPVTFARQARLKQRAR